MSIGSNHISNLFLKDGHCASANFVHETGLDIPGKWDDLNRLSLSHTNKPPWQIAYVYKWVLLQHGDNYRKRVNGIGGNPRHWPYTSPGYTKGGVFVILTTSHANFTAIGQRGYRASSSGTICPHNRGLRCKYHRSFVPLNFRHWSLGLCASAPSDLDTYLFF